ncbi:hypothetical protein E4L96_15030 [Massilia arenosa]|uniref:Uncharacterized protein n=1 Tax=Zemynaea arenosa TaxID=2561931 RepID=A0A4Y9S6S8_9BURK|nr:hypothetical protein [Massilia arenosa]TFW17152.1 hypothetical protein E4L96_15030 [Massilia arenosa]
MTSTTKDLTTTTAVPASRRRFMKLIAAGATSLAVQACGGGGGGAASSDTELLGLGPGKIKQPTNPSPGKPTPVTPVWTTVPDLQFTQGVAASISVAQYVSVSDASAFTLSLNSVALPPGVTFNAAKMTFDYDGVGAPANTTNHILTATV